MNWELIKEILRRVEIRYNTETKSHKNENPCEWWVELHADNSWAVIAQDNYGFQDTVHCGKGWETLSGLLAELRGK